MPERDPDRLLPNPPTSHSTQPLISQTFPSVIQHISLICLRLVFILASNIWKRCLIQTKSQVSSVKWKPLEKKRTKLSKNSIMQLLLAKKNFVSYCYCLCYSLPILLGKLQREKEQENIEKDSRLPIPSGGVNRDYNLEEEMGVTKETLKHLRVCIGLDLFHWLILIVSAYSAYVVTLLTLKWTYPKGCGGSTPQLSKTPAWQKCVTNPKNPTAN